MSCISVFSYIKPQPGATTEARQRAVYLSFPTSNHNRLFLFSFSFMLYICLFLHQTTTLVSHCMLSSLLYICLFLHQTTTIGVIYWKPGRLYICLFLHQTTTLILTLIILKSCISVFSYIKPQQRSFYRSDPQAVYLSFPTSNHNPFGKRYNRSLLYICLFLHQTTTYIMYTIDKKVLYICLFLHQTTTIMTVLLDILCCISVFSYIKPQLFWRNDAYCKRCISVFSYIKPQLFWL